MQHGQCELAKVTTMSDAISEVIGGGMVTLIGVDPYTPQRDKDVVHVPISWDAEWNPTYEGTDRGPVGIEDALQKRLVQMYDESAAIFRQLGLLIIAVLDEHPDMLPKVREIIPDPLELRQLVTYNLEW